MTQNWLKMAIREPLVHFLVAGAALFLVLGWFGTADSGGRSITIDEDQVARLANQWEQTWRRPPSPQELDGLIRDHIKDEVYFREAMKLGLDADDPIIRRRLRTKMEYLATAQAENTPPTVAALARYYATNKARYAADASYSFDQRFFGDSQSAAANAVAALNAGQTAESKPLSVPAYMKSASTSEVARQFGEEFTASLKKLPAGKWAGPVQSGFGWHAVRLNKVDASPTPPLAEIRQRVTNDWRAETRASREAAAYQTLLDGYDIRIAKP